MHIHTYVNEYIMYFYDFLKLVTQSFPTFFVNNLSLFVFPEFEVVESDVMFTKAFLHIRRHHY